MKTKFLDSFLILFFPDGVLKKTISAVSPGNVFVSVFIFTACATSVLIFAVKKYAMPMLEILPAAELLLIVAVYIMNTIVAAALSGFLNWIYSSAVKIKGRLLVSNFLYNFLCRSYLVPIWAAGFFTYLFFADAGDNPAVTGVLICLAIRLLDIEARLVKRVYELRLIQGYLIVFIELLLLLSGFGIGMFLRLAI
ncbi:MAG: hypothetical protein KJ893_00575 [Candidatus Omnitrophica bacterium]|nr:hypothetical protein [Candidatus Omnitrophota bacterium]MBU4478325.1 hypothetical protein [Candidatus Omnitrophota bacterium]MCG2704253.1 hypothetical protein [Candidatus Omnitrophota bacterium]